MVFKQEEVVSARNIRFEAYISSQASNTDEELKPTVPLYIYNKPQPPLQPQQHQENNGLNETPPEKKKNTQERTQFGLKGRYSTVIIILLINFPGKRYEKYWCMACQNWLNGGKVNITLHFIGRLQGMFCQGSVSGHLRKKHEEEDCQVIMITNQGMLKVNKEDFLPAKKM